VIGDGPQDTDAGARSAISTAAIATSTSVTGYFRATSSRTTAAAASPISSQSAVAWSANALGVVHSRSTDSLAKIRPTLSWIPRMIGRGKIRAAASRAPLAPRRTNVAPISSEPAAITSTPKPSEMAMAPKALSGCTGMGSR